MEWWGYCKYGNNVIIKEKSFFRKYVQLFSLETSLPCLTEDNVKVLSTQFFFHSFAIILTLNNLSLLSFDI